MGGINQNIKREMCEDDIPNIKQMTEEQFQEFITEVIPTQLFHVEPKDIDDESGGKLDETILVGLIANNPSCLKHKPLQWFLDYFLISEEEWNKQNNKSWQEIMKEIRDSK